MRAYLIDEISASDMKEITLFLKENRSQSSLDAIFWVEIPEDLLGVIQLEHRHCKPHVFALENGDNWIKAKFFVRSLKGMRCECRGYCTPQQRQFILDFVHHMIDALNIKTRKSLTSKQLLSYLLMKSTSRTLISLEVHPDHYPLPL